MNASFDNIYLTLQMSYLEEYMEKLIPMPNDVNRLVRLIRFLDKRVDAIQASLLPQQRKF